MKADERIRVTRERLEAEIADMADALGAVDQELERLQTRIDGLRAVSKRAAEQARALANLVLMETTP